MALFNESKEPTGESNSTEHKMQWLNQSDNFLNFLIEKVNFY